MSAPSETSSAFAILSSNSGFTARMPLSFVIARYFAYAFAALAVAWAATGRALRPVAEAEARERAFVCTASHDLVTPLMAVTANCDVLEAEASDQAGLAS